MEGVGPQDLQVRKVQKMKMSFRDRRWVSPEPAVMTLDNRATDDNPIPILPEPPSNRLASSASSRSPAPRSNRLRCTELIGTREGFIFATDWMESIRGGEACGTIGIEELLGLCKCRKRQPHSTIPKRFRDRCYLGLPGVDVFAKWLRG